MGGRRNIRVNLKGTFFNRSRAYNFPLVERIQQFEFGDVGKAFYGALYGAIIRLFLVGLACAEADYQR